MKIKKTKILSNYFFTIIFQVSLFFLFSQTANAAVYNIGPGQTYETFSAFHTAVVPLAGDVIDGGNNVFFEQLSVNADGISGLPIIYQNFKMTGAVTLGSWTDSGVNGEYYIEIPLDIYGTRMVYAFIKNGMLVNHRLEDVSVGNLLSGEWTKDTATSRIYYKPDDGLGHVFEAATGDLVMVNGHDYVKFENLQIYGGTNGIKSNTSINKSYGLEITNCAISNMWGHGIQIYSSDGMYIHDNDLQYLQKGGVKVGGVVAGPDKTGDNVRVEANTFYRISWANAEYLSEGHSIDIMPYSNTSIIKKNIFRENGYIGGYQYSEVDIGLAPLDFPRTCGKNVSTDGVDNTTVTENYFIDNWNGGIENGPDLNYKGSVALITKNIFENNGRASSTPTAEHRLRQISTKNDLGGNLDMALLIANNTFVGNRGSAGNPSNGAGNIYLGGLGVISGITIENNLHYNNLNKFDFRVSTQNGTVSFAADNNLYWSDVAGDRMFIGPNTGYLAYPVTNSFEAFMATNNATNDLQVDPLFVSAVDFHLTASSPARYAGSGGGDIGAYEYQIPPDIVAPGMPSGVSVE